MNSPFHFRTISSACLISSAVLVVVWLGLLPIAQAVVPAPDGGYAGGNTAEGTDALFSLNGGLYNTAVGLNALYTDSTGGRNTATGVNALRYNVMGASNTAVGVNALYFSTANFNTAIGDSALFHDTNGAGNTATGYQALFSNNAGSENTAIGDYALSFNTTGDLNTAVGFQALESNDIGNSNTAIGSDALLNTSGGANTAIGTYAGINATTGSGNVYIGAFVGGVGGERNTTRILNIGVTPQASGIFVTISGTGGLGDGKLGYQSSSERYKEEIKPMEQASESLYRLTPVTFRYKKELDPQGTRQYGLIAEQVAKVSPDLVVNDEDGKPATLRFLNIEAMMLNEFLKEHKKVQELEATVATLAATLKEQAAQIQKVSAQLAASNPTRGGPATEVAVNDH
jgi:hypothetical protein